MGQVDWVNQVDQINQTVVSIVKMCVATNQKDLDVKLPLVVIAVRSTPHRFTGLTSFELMTG